MQNERLPVNKVNNENIRAMQEKCQWHRSDVFIDNFEQTINIVLVFLLLTLNK